MTILTPMTQSALIPAERIEKAIYLIRGEKVMLDRDLATLYGVGTKVLKQAARRNMDRFPEDFMFVLNPMEFQDWRSQFVTSKADRKGIGGLLHSSAALGLGRRRDQTWLLPSLLLLFRGRGPLPDTE